MNRRFSGLPLPLARPQVARSLLPPVAPLDQLTADDAQSVDQPAEGVDLDRRKVPIGQCDARDHLVCLHDDLHGTQIEHD